MGASKAICHVLRQDGPLSPADVIQCVKPILDSRAADIKAMLYATITTLKNNHKIRENKGMLSLIE